VATLSSVLVVGGAIGPAWWTGEKGGLGMGVGLREMVLCATGSCTSRGLDGLGGGSPSWPKLGAIAFAIGWVAGLFLIAAAASAVASSAKWRARLGQAASAASLFALVVGAGFAWTYPGFDGLGAGWAMITYLGGAALGVGSAGFLIAAGGARPAP